MMSDKHDRVPAGNRGFVPGRRSILYAIAFALIFALSCANLGLIAQQLHKYGNHSSNYPSAQYKNALGLGLAAAIISLLVCFFHFWFSLELTALFALALAVFFGTAAGIIHRVTPFRASSCHRGQSGFPAIWQRFSVGCGRIVAIEGISWVLFALYTLLLIGTVRYMLNFTRRVTPGGHYGANTRPQAVV